MDSSGDSLFASVCLARQWIHVLHQYLALDEFRTISTSTWTHRGLFLCSHAEWRRCSVDASTEFVLRCSHLDSGQYFYVDSWLTGGLMVMGIFLLFFCSIFGLLFGVEPPCQCTCTGPCIIDSRDCGLHRRSLWTYTSHIKARVSRAVA